jgi:hypothetical protein
MRMPRVLSIIGGRLWLMVIYELERRQEEKEVDRNLNDRKQSHLRMKAITPAKGFESC